MTFPVPTRGAGNRFTVEQVRAWNLAGERALVDRTRAELAKDRPRYRAKNTTGAALNRGDVVEMYDLDTVKTHANVFSEPTVKIRAAIATSRLVNAAVVVEPAANNKWVGLAVAGIVKAKSVIAASDQVVVYDTAARRFKGAPAGGFELVAKDTTNGFVTVNLDRLRLQCIGRTAGAISFGGSGSVNVYVGGVSVGSITAHYDWFDGGNISSGMDVGCTYFDEDQKWRIMGAECEDSAAAPGILFTSPAIYSVDLGYPPKSNHKIDVPDIAFAADTLALAQQWGINTSKPRYAAAEPVVLIVEPYDGGYFLHVHCVDPAAKIGGEMTYCMVTTV